uniref:Uncharacterized protein n=1 Tax=Glossina pallidipes TaxID=7398 RepID=A0A1A9ZCL8_GLOPL
MEDSLRSTSLRKTTTNVKGLPNNSYNSFASCIITWKTYSNEVNRKKEESDGENSESYSFQQQHKKQGSEEQQKTTSTSFVPAVRNPFAEASEKTKGVYMNMAEIFTERVDYWGLCLYDAHSVSAYEHKLALAFKYMLKVALMDDEAIWMQMQFIVCEEDEYNIHTPY